MLRQIRCAAPFCKRLTCVSSTLPNGSTGCATSSSLQTSKPSLEESVSMEVAAVAGNENSHPSDLSTMYGGFASPNMQPVAPHIISANISMTPIFFTVSLPPAERLLPRFYDPVLSITYVLAVQEYAATWPRSGGCPGRTVRRVLVVLPLYASVTASARMFPFPSYVRFVSSRTVRVSPSSSVYVGRSRCTYMSVRLSRCRPSGTTCCP